MARATGRRVRLVLSLEETFQAVRRAACETRVRTGVRPDGRIAFQDVEANFTALFATLFLAGASAPHARS